MGCKAWLTPLVQRLFVQHLGMRTKPRRLRARRAMRSENEDADRNGPRTRRRRAASATLLRKGGKANGRLAFVGPGQTTASLAGTKANYSVRDRFSRWATGHFKERSDGSGR